MNKVLGFLKSLVGWNHPPGVFTGGIGSGLLGVIGIVFGSMLKRGFQYLPKGDEVPQVNHNPAVGESLIVCGYILAVLFILNSGSMFLKGYLQRKSKVSLKSS